MKRWIGRILIGFVFFFNIQCALYFIINPAQFAPGFELQGIPGIAAVQALGLLFLMWNVPYVVALWDPWRHRLSLYEAVAMQTIGLVGETTIFWSLPGIHQVARGSLLRFIWFDGGGLVALLLATWITRRKV